MATEKAIKCDYIIGIDFGDDNPVIRTFKRVDDNFLLIDSHIIRKAESKPEPEWLYGIYEAFTHGKNYVCGINGFVHSAQQQNTYETIEAAIPDLLKEDYWQGGPLKSRGELVFGIRQITDDDFKSWGWTRRGTIEFGAFYKGELIDWTNKKTAKKCLEEVLQKLTPAIPAKKLADLDTIPTK